MNNSFRIMNQSDYIYILLSDPLVTNELVAISRNVGLYDRWEVRLVTVIIWMATDTFRLSATTRHRSPLIESYGHATFLRYIHTHTSTQTSTQYRYISQSISLHEFVFVSIFCFTMTAKEEPLRSNKERKKDKKSKVTSNLLHPLTTDMETFKKHQKNHTNPNNDLPMETVTKSKKKKRSERPEIHNDNENDNNNHMETNTLHKLDETTNNSNSLPYQQFSP